MATLQFDPRTILATFAVMWLALAALAMMIWWTRRRYAGFGRWLLADLALFLALCLMSLRPKAPDWVSIVCGNAVLVIASVLFLEGARVFRGLSARVWPAYVGGLVTIGVLVFFLYVVPSLNARGVMMSAFIAVIFVVCAITLLRGAPVAHTFGHRLTAASFFVCAATQVARAAYYAFGPPLTDVFGATLINRAFFIATSGEMALLPVGFMLLADERVISDLRNASERVDRANAELADQRAAKEALSSLSGRLIEAQETERASIARELHDDLAQRVAALAIRLQSLVRILPSETPGKSDFQKTSKRVGDLAYDIQRMSHRLHSERLEFLGLTVAAESLCEELSRLHHIRINFSQDSVPHLTQNAALCLFRVLQEALNNAIKHANAERIDVVLCGTPTEVQLLVIDKGIGFDLESVRKKTGLGLISMNERLRLVRGEMHIESNPHTGTTIRAHVPLVSRGDSEMAL